MLSRRQLLKTSSSGVGYLAFAALAHEQAIAEKKRQGPLSPKEPHFVPKAKRVIFLSMRGARGLAGHTRREHASGRIPASLLP